MVTRPGRAAAASVVTASLALIGFMTLRPAEAPAGLPTFCIFCGPLGGVDFTLNTALFVPLGLGLRWLLGRWTTSVIIGAATTLVIEALQWRFIPGRDASLGDLLANTLGTMLGAWLAVAGLRWVNATSSEARRFAGAFGIAVTLVVTASAWMLQPIQTRYPQWVQWKPERRNLDTFQGRLMEVELNEIPLRPTQILQPYRSIDPVTRSVMVRATLTIPPAPTRRQAIIVRIANPLEEGFYLAQWGQAAVFRTRIAAERLKLRPLLVGLENALSVSDTETNGTTGEITLEANSNPRAMAVRRGPTGRETEVTLRRTIGLAWALLLPWDVALRPTWWLANALWLGSLTFPVAFLTIRSGGTRSGDSGRALVWWPLPLVLGSMVAASAASGLSPLGMGEWLGVLTGIVAGLAVERLTTARDRADLKAGARVGSIPS